MSGAAALVFEALWFRQLGLTFGNSIWGATMVLTSFMAGLALGNFLTIRFGSRTKNLARVYFTLELIIGLTGVLIVLVLPHLPTVFANLLGQFTHVPWLLNSLRLSLSFVLLAIPTTAMGATLPVMVKLLSQSNDNFGAVLGKYYGWNTLGAVAGALLAELVLIKVLGIQNTGLFAALLNLTAAVLVLKIIFPAQTQKRFSLPENKPGLRSFTLDEKRILVTSFLAGGIMLALEVVWFRFLLLTMSGTSLIFVVMLAVVLIGISLGGLFAAWLCKKRPDQFSYLGIILILNGIILILGYQGVNGIIVLFQESGINLSRFLVLAAYLMFPISFGSGVVFTFLGQFFKKTVANPIIAAGYLTLSNTIGATVGSLAAGLLILPLLGIESGLFLLALCYAGTALIIPVKRKNRFLSQVEIGFAITFIAMMFHFSYKLMNESSIEKLANEFPQHELLELREGLTETTKYYVVNEFEKPSYYRLVTNSFSMSATNAMAQRYMKLYVYLPMALNPDISTALLISYGVGSTAKALTNTKEIDSIDIVDISKDILEMNRHVYADNELPVSDPRVTVHIEDGRFFLNTTIKKYDLITSEPPPPKISGVVNLYSEEYFKLVMRRLNRGGYLTYWLPAHNLIENETLAIIKAFCNVFEDCSLWEAAGLNWMLVGSRQGIIDDRPETLLNQWQDETVAADLKNIGFEKPEQLGSLYIGGPGYLRELTKSTLPLKDNYPLRISPTKVSMNQIYSTIYAEIMNEDEAFKRYFQSPFASRFSTDVNVMKQHFQYQKYFKSLKIPIYAQEDFYRWDALNEFLRSSNLQTLPLWFMLSDWRTQEIVDEVQGNNEMPIGIHLEIARKQVAQREYQKAINSLVSHMEGKNWNFTDEEYCLYLFTLALGEQIDIAKALIQITPPSFLNSPTIQRFLKWYSKQYLSA